MTDSFWIQTEDWHTAGEPFRVVEKLSDGLMPQEQSVSRRRLAITNTPGHPLDQLRQSLCHEPRGHADMYGGFITPTQALTLEFFSGTKMDFRRRAAMEQSPWDTGL